MKIVDVLANPQVAHNEFYTIIVQVKSTVWIGAGWGRVCIYDGLNVIHDSGSFKIAAGETLDVVLNGTMPNHDLTNLKVSIIEEMLGFVEMCRDAKYCSILLAAQGEPTHPPVYPTPPIPDTPGVEPPEDFPWWDPAGWGSDGDESLGDWIMENLVLVLILILVIIIIIKFG